MMSENKNSPILSVAFYPWLALGHLTSFLRLANKLAERGHNVYYFVPTKTQSKLVSQNHYPNHLKFIPIDIPAIDGLPPGSETTNDVPASARHLIFAAMDMTRDAIEAHFVRIKPDVVLFDFAQWIPDVARKLGLKSIFYSSAYITRTAYFGPYHLSTNADIFRTVNLAAPPPGFPCPSIRMTPKEVEIFLGLGMKQHAQGGQSLVDRICIGIRECDAFAVKSCKEMEGPCIEYVQSIFNKPVLLAGPMVPKPPSSKLDKDLDEWLKGFDAASVIFCAFGSDYVLSLNQFHQFLLGLELTGRPFLAALKPPIECETIESALPEGFASRTKNRGMVDGGWVQQQQILRHPSIGCFITHCGVGSLSEAMASECQVVLMPQQADQFLNARQMSLELKIGVEVERSDKDGLFTKEAVHKAVSLVMEEDSQVGREVRANHAKWRDFVLREGLEDSYISTFIRSLQQLLLIA